MCSEEPGGLKCTNIRKYVSQSGARLAIDSTSGKLVAVDNLNCETGANVIVGNNANGGLLMNLETSIGNLDSHCPV